MSAPPGRAFQTTEVPPRGRRELLAWATEHNVVDLLEVELSALGIPGVTFKVIDVLARRPRELQLSHDAGTIEDGVVAMQEQKRAQFPSVLEGQDGAASPLDEVALLALLDGAADARGQVTRGSQAAGGDG
ncbi:MAG: hypothetical protein IT383_01110 [Deltaproteobacteria bacterium]|nr:hypothetical protein [Deltaproteobacteria bacterium]